MFMITDYPKLVHDCSDNAERVIECFYPAGYFYEVVELAAYPGNHSKISFGYAVKVFNCTRLIGYAYTDQIPTDSTI